MGGVTRIMLNILQIDCSYAKLKEAKENRLLEYRYVDTHDLLLAYCIDFTAKVVYCTQLYKIEFTGINHQTEITEFLGFSPVQDNSLEDGISSVFSSLSWPESSSKGSILVTPLVHRKNLVYKPIGLEFRLNTDADGTYNKKTKTMQLTQVSGTNYIYVNSIKHVAPFFRVTLSEGGNSETKTIYQVDATNKKLTFTSTLIYSYTTAASVTIDLVDVTKTGNITSLDFYISENHSDMEYQGIDIEAVKVQGDFRNDRLNVYAWHPAYGPSVNLGDFLEDIPLPSGLWEQHLEATTTTTINPGLIIRLNFETSDSEERFIGVIGEVWRQ